LYQGTEPHYLRIANLQKGMILVYRGRELIGEGTGFGVPVVRYQNKEYFSGSSTMQSLHKDYCTKIVKQFVLDIVSEKRFRRVKLENRITRKLRKSIEDLYQRHRHWRLLVLNNLSESIGLQTSFVRVKPVGKVVVTYCVKPPHINVKADFKLKENDSIRKIFLLNEQSSKYFRRYCDSKGTVLLDKHIGAWGDVETAWACVSNKSGEVGFRLWKVEDAVLHRGREFLEGTFDWVGLDYEVSPEKTCFEYDIEILGSHKQK
jgi:hypothetical protein